VILLWSTLPSASRAFCFVLQALCADFAERVPTRKDVWAFEDTHANNALCVRHVDGCAIFICVCLGIQFHRCMCLRRRWWSVVLWSERGHLVCLVVFGFRSVFCNAKCFFVERSGPNRVYFYRFVSLFSTLFGRVQFSCMSSCCISICRTPSDAWENTSRWYIWVRYSSHWLCFFSDFRGLKIDTQLGKAWLHAIVCLQTCHAFEAFVLLHKNTIKEIMCCFTIS